jgi:hypothetical protein
LDLAIAPNGRLLLAKSDRSNAEPSQPREIVEFTTGGVFVTQFSVEANLGQRVRAGAAKQRRRNEVRVGRR